jgi:hypothetical protein
MHSSILSAWPVVFLDYLEWIVSVAYADLDGMRAKRCPSFKNHLGRSRWCIELATDQSKVPIELSKTKIERTNISRQCVAKLLAYLTDTNEIMGERNDYVVAFDDHLPR